MRSALLAASSLPAIACGLCLSSWLLACEQDSDVVLRAEALPLDGSSDMEDAAAPPPDNLPDATVDSGIACDPTIAAVYIAFAGVERDGCTFAFNDTELGRLLVDYIFNQQPPREMVEGRGPSPCDFPELGFDFVFPDETLGRLELCPGYCTVLEMWLDDHEAQSRACSPGSSM